MSYSIPSIINGQILRKETDLQHRKKNSVNVCIKDPKISDVGTVLCHRNMRTEKVAHKIVFLGDILTYKFGIIVYTMPNNNITALISPKSATVRYYLCREL